MKIAILNISGGNLSMGYINYLHHILPCLAGNEKVSSLLVAMPEQISLSAWQNKYNFIDWVSLRTSFFFQQNIGKDAIDKIDRFDPDVIFIPTSRYWKKKNIPTVNMVRNMEPLVQPLRGHILRNRIKNLLLRRITKSACRDAARVIAVSRFVYEFLTDVWNTPSSKLGIVRYGTPELVPSEKSTKPSAIKSDSTTPFIFTAGSIVPYRGLEDIIKAMAILNNKGQKQKLFIAGASLKGTFGYEDQMRQLAEETGVASDIIWLGQLSPEEMSWCFRNCDLFVMTSQLEACPNLVLEALEHGGLNISSNKAPMPEFFGDGAKYYESGSPENLADQIIDIKNSDNNQKQHLRRLSHDRSNEFNWSVTADQTILNLQQAIEDFHKTKTT